MKNSEFLKLVKKELLNNRSNGFVCFAINNVKGFHNNRDKLRTWVAKLLGRHSTYGSWLMYNHPEKYKEWTKKKCPIEPRIQWVNWMIKHWQRKEKIARLNGY